MAACFKFVFLMSLQILIKLTAIKTGAVNKHVLLTAGCSHEGRLPVPRLDEEETSV
jgi:hypothetical protein